MAYLSYYEEPTPMETRTIVVTYTDGSTRTAQHTGRWAAFAAWCRLWMRKAEVKTLTRVME